MINEKDYNSKSMLYRFRSDSEYNFNALLNNEMFAATPNFLNDPLDCPITYDLDKLYKKLLKRKAFINKYAKEIFPSSKDKIRPSNFENFELYEAYRDSIFEEERSKLLDVNNSSIVKDFIKFLANDIIFKVRECFGIV